MSKSNDKQENRKIQLKNEILEKIRENPTVINNMPMQRLVQLDKMYDEEIKQNDIKIQQLQNKLKN